MAMISGNHKIIELEKACKEAGIPLTHQRRVIMSELSGRADHPTAEEIYQATQKTLPGISRTTVYRVLETLVKLKLAVKVNYSAAVSRFDADCSTHFHAVCDVCSKVIDLPDSVSSDIPYPKISNSEFMATGLSLNITGTCPECLNSSHKLGNTKKKENKDEKMALRSL